MKFIINFVLAFSSLIYAARVIDHDSVDLYAEAMQSINHVPVDVKERKFISPLELPLPDQDVGNDLNIDDLYKNPLTVPLPDQYDEEDLAEEDFNDNQSRRQPFENYLANHADLEAEASLNYYYKNPLFDQFDDQESEEPIEEENGNLERRTDDINELEEEIATSEDPYYENPLFDSLSRVEENDSDSEGQEVEKSDKKHENFNPLYESLKGEEEATYNESDQSSAASTEPEKESADELASRYSNPLFDSDNQEMKSSLKEKENTESESESETNASEDAYYQNPLFDVLSEEEPDEGVEEDDIFKSHSSVDSGSSISDSSDTADTDFKSDEETEESDDDNVYRLFDSDSEEHESKYFEDMKNLKSYYEPLMEREMSTTMPKLKLWDLFKTAFLKKNPNYFYSSLYDYSAQLKEHIFEVQQKLNKLFPQKSLINFHIFTNQLIDKCNQINDKAKRGLEKCYSGKCNRWQLIFSTISYYWKKSGIQKQIREWQEKVKDLMDVYKLMQ